MVKLFIFALFIYVIYRLLTGGRKKKSVGDERRNAAQSELPAADLLVEDPVCHIYIPKRQAIVLHDTKTPVYFCSEQCRKIYSETHETNRRENG